MSTRDRDSAKNIIIVAFAVCLVCAIAVSGAAVSLRPLQQANAELDMKSNVLLAAGLRRADMSVEEQFKRFETRVVDLSSGTYAENVDPDEFDQREAARDPARSRVLSSQEDMASISRLEDQALVYLVRNDSGGVETIVLPVRGYGLWSTMYGLLALEGDLDTVRGLAFYEQEETPGLGGEITNPKWTGQWVGKKIYDENGDVALSVVGNQVPEEYDIDAISGATLTSRGVDNLIQFWMGEQGFKPYLNNLSQGEVS